MPVGGVRGEGEGYKNFVSTTVKHRVVVLVKSNRKYRVYQGYHALARIHSSTQEMVKSLSKLGAAYYKRTNLRLNMKFPTLTERN